LLFSYILLFYHEQDFDAFEIHSVILGFNNDFP